MVQTIEEALRSGEWRAVQDSRGRTYYCNTKTKAVTWDLAKELAAVTKPGSPRQNTPNSSNPTTTASPMPVPVAASTVNPYEERARTLLAEGTWKVVRDTQGRLFYRSVSNTTTANLALHLEVLDAVRDQPVQQGAGAGSLFDDLVHAFLCLPGDEASARRVLSTDSAKLTAQLAKSNRERDELRLQCAKYEERIAELEANKPSEPSRSLAATVEMLQLENAELRRVLSLRSQPGGESCSDPWVRLLGRTLAPTANSSSNPKYKQQEVPVSAVLRAPTSLRTRQSQPR